MDTTINKIQHSQATMDTMIPLSRSVSRKKAKYFGGANWLYGFSSPFV
jgi:hypothetical protein